MTSLRIVLDTKDHKWNIPPVKGVYCAHLDVGALDLEDETMIEQMTTKLARLLLESVRCG